MQLASEDRMAGLETPEGRRFRPDRKGIIDLPEELAGYGRRAARLTPLFRVYRRQFGGFDAAELGARRAAWEQRQGGGSRGELIPTANGQEKEG